MRIIINVVAVIIVVSMSYLALTVTSAWSLDGKFYIKGNFARRKNWIERLHDGFEILKKL